MEHPLNNRLHGQVQSFFNGNEADFANANPATAGLKLAEPSDSTTILSVQS
jgi:hypothetical protein